MKRILKFALAVLAASAGLLYGGDYMSAKLAIPRRQVFEYVRVDQLYTVLNKYGETRAGAGGIPLWSDASIQCCRTSV